MTVKPLGETKLQSVCAALLKLAGQCGPGGKLPPLRVLGTALPASMATLTAALTELETRGVLVRRHGVGIFVSEDQPRRRIALLCRPDFFRAVGPSPFWGILLEQARRRAEQEREELTFLFSADDPEGGDLTESQRDALQAGRFDGIVGVGLDQRAARWIVERKIPFVAFAGPGPLMVGFRPDDVERKGREALAALGCARIETLALGPGDVGEPRQRLGYLWGRALLARPAPEWPDGILSHDDMLTLGLLGAMHEAGVAPGRPIRLATHANADSPTLLGWEGSLIRLEVSPARIVARLFDLLEDAMDGAAPSPGFHALDIDVRYGARTASPKI